MIPVGSCGYSLLGLIGFCNNRLFKQPHERGFSGCTIKRIGGASKLLAVKQTLDVTRYCVRGHYEKGIDCMDVAPCNCAA